MRCSMKFLARLPLVTCVSCVITMCEVSCAPSIQEMSLSQEVVDNLPREQALHFLQTLKPSLSPVVKVHCLFEQDGVVRWLPSRGQVLPGKRPYASLVAHPERPGIMIVVVLYEKGKPWCIIPAESTADDIGRGDYKRFTGKILTALLSLGVKVKSYGKVATRSG